MEFKNIVVLGDNTFGDVLGKKGTESDITLYNYKEETQALSFVVPTEYPGKIQPVVYAINMANAAIVKVDAISRTLGEIIVALECADIKKGYIVMGENLIREQILPIIKGTVLQNYKFIDNDRIAIIDTLSKEDLPHSEGNVRIPIDHFFNVTSVGTIILGTTRGKIKKFDEFIMYPTDKKVTVKSIQVFDEDKDEAEDGSRAGLSLKGVSVAELERGYVLAKEGTMKVAREVDVKFKVQKFWKYPVNSGGEYIFVCGLQQLRATIKEGALNSGEEGILKIGLLETCLRTRRQNMDFKA
ncbi:MAG: hypothetical protein BWK75_02590 [Candidatus Altiarchaeales archaeon A3]|nr:MAG: hypothetical protein BWK75_02590 [Candidatus Altiarchaeales archaeon A3]